MREASSNLAGDPKSVVRVPKLRRDARACGAAAELHLMTPRAAAGYAAQAGVGTAGISLRRCVVVLRRVPVAAPLVNVLADVVKTIRVRSAAADRSRTDPIVL